MTKKTNQDAVVVTTELATDAAEIFGRGMPFVAPLVNALRVAHEVHRNRRLQKLFAVAIDCDERLAPASEAQLDAVRQFTENDEDVLALVRRALDEDDEEKVWFYGAMLRAFALGEVEHKNERLRMLRFTNTIVGDDLEFFVSFATKVVAKERGENWHEVPAIGEYHPITQALKLAGLHDETWSKDLKTPRPNSALHRLVRIADVAARARNILAVHFRR